MNAQSWHLVAIEEFARWRFGLKYMPVWWLRYQQHKLPCAPFLLIFSLASRYSSWPGLDAAGCGCCTSSQVCVCVCVFEMRRSVVQYRYIIITNTTSTTLHDSLVLFRRVCNKHALLIHRQQLHLCMRRKQYPSVVCDDGALQAEYYYTA